MKRVLFRGPVLTQSGYGVHSRQIAKWLLNRKDFDVKFVALPWGDTPWILDRNRDDGLVDKIMTRTTSPDSHSQKYDLTFQLQLPDEWDPQLGHKNVGITAGIETDRCNPKWTEAVSRMNLVVVPSQHAKQSLGKTTPNVRIIPESYNEKIDAADGNLKLDITTNFNFLIFGQLTGMNHQSDRKNIFLTLKWMCETFKNDPDVGIVLKTNAGRNTKIDKSIVTNVLKQLLSEVRRGPNPKVYLLHGDMNDNDVANLYKHNSIKALVSLTRGEGFGLPLLEAAASGLPVIATNWSGHLDFLNLGKYVSVNYQLQPVHESKIDDRLFIRGSRWAEASEDDFKRRIQKFRTSSEIPKEWAVSLQDKIKNTHSFEKISAQYDALLAKELEE